MSGIQSGPRVITVGIMDFATSGSSAETVNAYVCVSPFFHFFDPSVPRRSEYVSPQRQLSWMAMPCSRSATNVSMRPVPPSAMEISVPFPPITWMPPFAGRANVPWRFAVFHSLPVTGPAGCVSVQPSTTRSTSSTGVNE